MPLRTAVVLATTETSCTVATPDGPADVDYAPFFPTPRADRVSPGHVIALDSDGAPDVVVWRWFDGVVVGADGEDLQVWEPLHGRVTARPRQGEHALGSRVLVSAGLPGADWWVAGPAAADVPAAELDAVRAFLHEHGLAAR